MNTDENLESQKDREQSYERPNITQASEDNPCSREHQKLSSLTLKGFVMQFNICQYLT
jgi:hypothetical protein